MSKPRIIKRFTCCGGVGFHANSCKGILDMKELDKWKDIYDFNCQIYAGDYNIYVSKTDVEVFSTGGHATFKEALDIVLKWLERVNSKAGV